jgi:hypothetical protein
VTPDLGIPNDPLVHDPIDTILRKIPRPEVPEALECKYEQFGRILPVERFMT